VPVSEILVLEDGWLTERQAQELGAWHAENTPLTDTLAFEAHWMMKKTQEILHEAGRPDDKRFTVPRYTLLAELYRAEDKSLSMTEISRLMNVTLTNVTQLINGLVQLDLVERLGDEGDKRKTIAHLSPDGEG